MRGERGNPSPPPPQKNSSFFISFFPIRFPTYREITTNKNSHRNLLFPAPKNPQELSPRYGATVAFAFAVTPGFVVRSEATHNCNARRVYVRRMAHQNPS
ncbi:hypothetical protein WN944_001433 [Citrus x changshan-huyou]|uniref:Uncharacterized protein n=1 Tax=Citrus x changshan-huyou TaxID=2935761 RepID=A0AAP0MEQ0_9ROSI